MKSFLIGLALIVNINVFAQNDVTDNYLVNPEFNDNSMVNNAPKGWTLDMSTDGVQSKISTAEKADGLIPANQNHWQLWKANGNVVGKAYQKVSGLPTGKYQIKAVVSATFEGELSLFVNNVNTPVVSGEPKLYEVETIVDDGECELGLSVNSTNGVLIDFDSFQMIQYDADQDDILTMLKNMYDQCVADTLETTRQTWYNKEEILNAIEAYNNIKEGDDNLTEVLELLNEAHRHYVEIKEAYNNLRDEAKELFELTNDSKFVFKSEIRSIRTTSVLNYRKDVDNYEWVCQSLEKIRFYAELFTWYLNLNKACSLANQQLKNTDYEGKEELKAILSEAYQVQISATEIDDYRNMVDAVNKAKENYLKNRPSEWITIKNGNLWKTTAGSNVQAHAPGFVRVGDIWYMVGEDRTNTWNPDVNLYCSTDLVKWKYVRKIIQNGVTTAELGKSRMIERPKILYNEKTDKFVVWCHYESGDYGASEAACFECDSVNGAYKYVWSGRPLDIKSRDCNVFQDTDGKAYFISTTDENRHLGLFQLDDDYHEAVVHTQLFAWQSREAPAIVKINNRYFMFNSACSGWDPNQCKMAYSNKINSGWSSLSNVGNPIAFDTQAAAILEVKGTKTTTYLYVGDRWQDPGLPESKTIIFPISFNGTACTFKYHERFDINFVTGEWRETPVDDYFADKKNWKVVDFSSQENTSGAAANNAIDDDRNTIWHTKYSGTADTAPFHITVDTGKNQNFKGFLAMPRMDSSTNGLIRKYQFLVSEDGEEWTEVSSGTWLPYATEVLFNETKFRYFKLVSLEGTYASLAEIDLVMGQDETTGVEDTNMDDSKSVRQILYLTIDGIMVDEPQNGLFIQKTIYSDGSQNTRKIFRR